MRLKNVLHAGNNHTAFFDLWLSLVVICTPTDSNSRTLFGTNICTPHPHPHLHYINTVHGDKKERPWAEGNLIE